MATVPLGEVSWERMIGAVEKVRERMLRAVAALEKARVPYAVVGGNAVAAWVSRVDESAVRNTRDVDILLRRSDLEAAIKALGTAGFIHRRVAMLARRGRIEIFVDGPDAKARDAIHVVLAGEKVRQESPFPAPDVCESEATPTFRLVTLEALVRMKLTSFRDKDRTHLRDLIDVGLVDKSWIARLPFELRARLQQLFDNPEG